MIRLSPLVPLLLAAGLSCQRAPDHARAANLLFRVPDGYVRKDEPDGRVRLLRQGLPEGRHASLLLLKGQDMREGFDAWVDRTWAACLEGKQVSNPGKRESGKRPRTLDPWLTHWAVYTEGGVEFATMILAVHSAAGTADARAEAILYTADNRESFDKHVGDAVALFEQGLRFCNRDTIVRGRQPLTRWTVERVADFLEWLIGAPITEAQRAECRNLLAGYWRVEDQQEIENVLEILDAARQAAAMGVEERELVRVKVLEEVVVQWRQEEDDDAARWALSLYEAAHQPIASGNPPLTRQTAEAYLELIMFLTGELRGSKVPTDGEFRTEWIQKVKAAYASMSGDEQKAIAQMPVYWSALRLLWPSMADAEKQAIRDQWKPVLEPLLASLPQPAVDTREVVRAEMRRSMIIGNMLTISHNTHVHMMASMMNMAGHNVTVGYRFY